MAEIELTLNVYSYTLIVLILSLLFVPLFFARDPDTHPFSLQHQSLSGAVRKSKETAIHRSLETPHSNPLRTGLGLKGEKPWESRDGELRDVWRLYAEKGPGKVLNVTGVEVEEVPVERITKQIHILGSYLRAEPPSQRIAIFLHNSIENLVISFACAYYGLPLILVPYPAKLETITSILERTNADLLFAPAGSAVPLSALEPLNALKNIIYVVEPGSRHMDWSTPPGSRIQTRALHEILAGGDTEGMTLPPPSSIDPDSPAIITTYTHVYKETHHVVTFTHRNLIAAIGSQYVSLPIPERLSDKDTFLPADTLSHLPARILTYTSLVSLSTLALNSVSGSHLTLASLESASRPANPTVIVASPHTLLRVIRSISGSQIEMWHWLVHFAQNRTLAAGRMPYGNWLTRVNDFLRPNLTQEPGRLRMVFTYELALTETQPLNSKDLNDLRVFLSAKVVYALHHPLVAGPVTQQNPYDYRVDWPKKLPNRKLGIGRKCAHFGGICAGAEVWLRDVEGGKYKVTDKPWPRGELCVRGPVVAGEKEAAVGLGIVAKIRGDGCLEYV